MKQLIKKVLESTKTTIVLSTIIIILLPFCWETIVYNFECLAGYLYGTGADNKGKLLSTILTAIGGICVIWGLYLNNKKVDEQTRQNDIAVQNSNDKRFGEAIGYLNDANEGIAIGGAYALYQLAKEDSRYAPIITNIFYNYVNDNTDKQDKKSYQTILSLLFSKDNPFVFDGEPQYENIVFEDIIMYSKVAEIKFLNCKFINNANIKGSGRIYLYNCTIKYSTFVDFNNVGTFGGKYSNWTIISKKRSFIHIIANELCYSKILIKNVNYLELDIKLFNNVDIYSNYIYDLQLQNILQKDISSKLKIHYVSKIEKKTIKDTNTLKNGAIEFIKDDAMKSDSFYRQKAGFED